MLLVAPVVTVEAMVPDPMRILLTVDADGLLLFDCFDPVVADRAYRSELHRLVGESCGATRALIRLEGEPYGLPVRLRAAR